MKIRDMTLFQWVLCTYTDPQYNTRHRCQQAENIIKNRLDIDLAKRDAERREREEERYLSLSGSKP